MMPATSCTSADAVAAIAAIITWPFARNDYCFGQHQPHREARIIEIPLVGRGWLIIVSASYFGWYGMMATVESRIIRYLHYRPAPAHHRKNSVRHQSYDAEMP